MEQLLQSLLLKNSPFVGSLPVYGRREQTRKETMQLPEHHIHALQQHLALNRATLQELWEQRAIYEQALTALKTSEAAQDTRRDDQALLHNSRQQEPTKLMRSFSTD
jgi:hypothetical protein